MNLFKKSAKSPGKQPGNDTPEKPPIPTLTTGETILDNLPVLTEIVAETGQHLPHVLSAAEKQQLLHKLEKHIETLLSQKLALYLEQVQRVAIDQAIHELKMELPELLRNALNAHLDSR
jgi:hypothetical protein